MRLKVRKDDFRRWLLDHRPDEVVGEPVLPKPLMRAGRVTSRPQEAMQILEGGHDAA